MEMKILYQNELRTIFYATTLPPSTREWRKN